MYKIPKRENIFESYFSKLSKKLLPFFIKTNLSPNQITLISGIFGVIGSFLILYGDFYLNIVSGVFIQIFAILDLVDGDIARHKKMQSNRGMWLDIFFDKTNDFIIIICFTIGAFLVNPSPIVLFMGMCLMGVNFYIQFIMILNNFYFKENRSSNKNLIDKATRSKRKLIGFIGSIVFFYREHVSLQHSQFLVLVSFFLIVNKLELGLYIITIHGALSLVISILTNFIKIKG
jgi:phosphatidylglycerophosphate synthase